MWNIIAGLVNLRYAIQKKFVKQGGFLGKMSNELIIDFNISKSLFEY